MSLPFTVLQEGWCERLPHAVRTRSSSILRLGVFALLLTCPLQASSAAVPTVDRDARPSSPTTYAMRHWDTDDGLPSHTIYDIRQAPDGYLWMATTAGLIRFDGHRFSVFDQRNAGLTN